ncbi:ferrochelatase [Gilliamella sp. wkB178]|uniref:ferrochelatase n=1 Tax=Gilliamella sp. wkB178 TaxID=3120259 RepID=UPI00080E0CFA|nr:ferrochelatase [Gilliamella apicola]OCG07106.1 ferrochelatase [Gilliamella apicola]
MQKKHGLLLINLGTPSDITPTAIKNYLTEFLLDRHVVDLPYFIWYTILKYIVLPKRVPYIINHYRKIWLNGASPLLHFSQLLRDKLSYTLPYVRCELAMTYGEPNMQSALENLKSCDELIILPLFPQYSTTTTLAVFDKLKPLISTYPILAHAQFIRDYASHPSYIHALYLQIKQSFLEHGQPEVLLLSYHGIPERYISKRQDDYIERCELTTKLLVEKCQANGINLPIHMAYQSKFGKGKWVEPNTSDVLQKLANNGKKTIQVMCPGFSADCIETIYEIDEQNRAIFLNAGGENFFYIPALNDSDIHINLLLELINYTETYSVQETSLQHCNLR